MTREQQIRTLYTAYVETYEAKVAQWKPERLDYSECKRIDNIICSGRLKPKTRASKVMHHGTRLDLTGVYEIDGAVYDFCQSREDGVAWSQITCDKYESWEAWDNFSYPLPRYMWHESW